MPEYIVVESREEHERRRQSSCCGGCLVALLFLGLGIGRWMLRVGVEQKSIVPENGVLSRLGCWIDQVVPSWLAVVFILVGIVCVQAATKHDDKMKGTG